jgi:hypothetical protein
MMERDVAPLGFGIVILLALAGLARAQDTSLEAVRQQIPAPECLSVRGKGQEEAKACTRQDHQEWLADIQHWHGERRMRIGYDGSRYGLPALKWTQSSFFQPQLMVEDRYFYDPVTRRYTVDRYLDDLEKRYGGIDAVLIWATYPNLGCGIVAHFISRALFSST